MGQIRKNNVSIVVRGNEENDNEYAFSPIVEFTVVKLIFLFCLVLQNKCHIRDFDSQNALPNGK